MNRISLIPLLLPLALLATPGCVEQSRTSPGLINPGSGSPYESVPQSGPLRETRKTSSSATPENYAEYKEILQR